MGEIISKVSQIFNINLPTLTNNNTGMTGLMGVMGAIDMNMSPKIQQSVLINNFLFRRYILPKVVVPINLEELKKKILNH